MATRQMFPIANVTDIDIAFGVDDDIDKLLPPYASIPQQFKNGHTKWNELTSDWFFVGVRNLDLKARDGVDTVKALRHIKAVLRSFAPKHEHKEAGVAFLLDQWFTDATWQRAK